METPLNDIVKIIIAQQIAESNIANENIERHNNLPNESDIDSDHDTRFFILGNEYEIVTR